MAENTADDHGGTRMPPMEVAGRAARVWAAVADRCDLFIVTKPANVRWLTGFTGSNGAVMVTADGLTVATDARYGEQVVQQLDEASVDATVVTQRDVLGAMLDIAGQQATVGLESHHVTWQQRERAVDLLGPESVVPVERAVERARETKDAGELARLSRAASIADRALGSVLADLPGSVTERMIARRLEATMIDLGADDVSFPTIVAAGPNSARPHAVPSDRELALGDLLVIDMGAAVDGYGSDMTRTFAVGSFTVETETMYRAVEAAQRAGVARVAAGVTTDAIDAACRAVLAERGLAEEFVHGTGHGIGLEIHETPFLGKTDPAELRADHVVTVEPGVYRAGVGGVRIEDSVVVTADGCRPITNSPKDPTLGWRPAR
ncbi:MAG: aminopeptidase P family protein [Acidimicrobiia bacterium]|nr:aminopeptidase P family protein [Acidimicrobiia bacterium]MDH5521762.1 aminopeptidase P family protein [Acidimicrobiia bacterium]